MRIDHDKLLLLGLDGEHYMVFLGRPNPQKHNNTTTQQHNNTTTQQHNNTTTQQQQHNQQHNQQIMQHHTAAWWWWCCLVMIIVLYGPPHLCHASREIHTLSSPAQPSWLSEDEVELLNKAEFNKYEEEFEEQGDTDHVDRELTGVFLQEQDKIADGTCTLQ